MKKIFYFVATVMVASVFASCGNKCGQAADADSLAVDTAVVDTAVVDSVAADSIAADSVAVVAE